MTISVVIMTFNSEDVIDGTLRSALAVSDDVHIVDSYSTDRTVELARGLGANVVQHEFIDGGKQRNWSIQNLPLKFDWELHLDSDERLTDELISEINALKQSFPDDVDGYHIARLVHFLGQPIRHGGMYPIWHLRLFRRGKGRCETRAYDQHFIVEGQTARLTHPFIDDQRNSISEWSTRHIRWAESQVTAIANERNDEITPRLFGTPIERQRALRRIFHKFPLLLRPLLFFMYRYFLRLGFLDGRAGLIFFVLQTFWFNFLVDAKIVEQRMRSADSKGGD